MDINVNKDGANLQIVLSGRLDTNTAPELDAALKENLEGVTGLVIDLAEVQYVMDVFEATGFVDIMDIEP